MQLEKVSWGCSFVQAVVVVVVVGTERKFLVLEVVLPQGTLVSGLWSLAAFAYSPGLEMWCP